MITFANIGAELATAPAKSFGYTFLSHVANAPAYEQPKIIHGPVNPHVLDMSLLNVTISFKVCLK